MCNIICYILYKRCAQAFWMEGGGLISIGIIYIYIVKELLTNDKYEEHKTNNEIYKHIV